MDLATIIKFSTGTVHDTCQFRTISHLIDSDVNVFIDIYCIYT